MMQRFLRSRGLRKFVRNRMAMAASAVILVYLIIALAIVLGALTREAAAERVMPNQQFGFLEKPGIEKRFDRARWYVQSYLSPTFDRPGGISSLEDPRQTLDTLSLAERRIADVPIDELEASWQTLSANYEALDAMWLEREDVFGEAADLDYEIEDLEFVIEDMRAEGEPQEDIDEVVAELEEYRVERDALLAEAGDLLGEIGTQLDVVEAGILEVMPFPKGFAGLAYGFRTFLGSDNSGRSIAVRVFYGIKLAFQIGIVVGIVSVLIGTLLGGAAGYFGGWVDHLVMWLVSIISSVPYLVWLLVLAFIFVGNPLLDNPVEHPELQLVKLFIAMCFAFWVGTARVVRGEVMKIKELEYVQAATAIGFGRLYILIKHVIPNTLHLMFINFSLVFIGAIKSEVILSFLGLGVSGQPSWGVIISLGREDVQNFFFWNVLSATVLMFGLVLAFNILSDALQDAFDPKHV